MSRVLFFSAARSPSSSSSASRNGMAKRLTYLMRFMMADGNGPLSLRSTRLRRHPILDPGYSILDPPSHPLDP